MNGLLQLLSYLLNTLMYLILIYYFLPSKLKVKEILPLFVIILIDVILIINTGNWVVLLLLVSVSLYLALIRQNRIINIMAFGVGYLFVVVVDQILTLFWNAFICPVSLLLENRLYYNLYVISAIFLLILICPFICKYFHMLLEKMQNKVTKHMLILIASNLASCLLIFLFNIIIGEYIGYNSKIIGFNGLLFGCYFFISMVLIINITKANEKQMEMEKRQEMFQQLQEYTSQIEYMYSTLRSFKHDYTNIMLTMSGYIEAGDMEGLRRYFEKEIMPLNLKMTSDRARLNQLMHIKNIEVKSVVSAKLLYAMELGISVEVEILEEIANIKIDIVDLVRILGIFLDNAIEAAMETDCPKLQFAGIYSERDCVFIIKNTFVDKGVTISSLKQPDISTKGSGRGIGLFTVQEIVAKYKNIYWDTEMEEEYFLQRLRIVNNI